MPVTFPRYLSKVDFGMNTGTTAVVTSEWTNVGSKQVGAKQEIAFGVGNTLNGVDTRRTATIKLYDTNGVQLTDGQLRLIVADANLINQPPVQEDLLSNWSNGVAMEEKNVVAGEDGYLKIQVKTGSYASTINLANASTQVDIPITLTNLGI